MRPAAHHPPIVVVILRDRPWHDSNEKLVKPSYRHKKLRLQAFDYRLPGPYFVTICTSLRTPLLGRVTDHSFIGNPAGEMVAGAWEDISGSFPSVDLDTYVVMPNHTHALLMFATEAIEQNPRLGDVMKWFKTVTTNRYIHGVQHWQWPRFEGHLWQRNYHDHIIRDERDMNRIREYIANNPARWEDDRYHGVS